MGPMNEMRGPEEPAFEEELQYFAKATGIPYEGIHVLQFLNELGTMMIPIVNFTGYHEIFGEKWAKKLQIDHIDLSNKD